MKYLVPLDGSPASEAVLPWVKLLAEADQEGEVELLRTVRPLQEGMLIPELAVASPDLMLNEKVEKAVGDYLEKKKDSLPGCRVKTVKQTGYAADTILRRSESADMIVMGSHGETGFTRWLLGSVTTKVVRASDTPVMVITAREEEPPVPKLERILVPLDGSKTAERALSEAARLARNHGAKLLLYEGITYRSESQEKDDWQELLAKGYLREQSLKMSELDVEFLVRPSTSGPGIVEYGEEVGADLIVMGSHGRSGISRWVLGSVAESVVQKAKCPVLIVYDRERL